MPNTLLTPAILNGYTPKKDGSMTLHFATQELSDVQKVEVITHYLKFGWLGFADSEDATDLEIPAEAPQREGKSQSQRLRASLYVLMKSRYPEASASELDRRIYDYMNDLIEKVQEKIDEP